MPTRFVYIMGHGFSGSTLLTLLLGAHPEIATVGEMGIAPRTRTPREEFLCSCRVPIVACPFWREVTAGMARRGETFDILLPQLDFRVEAGGVGDLLLRAVQRGPLFETARSVGLKVVPSARRQLASLLRRYEALIEVMTELKGCSTFLDSSKRPERAVFLSRIPSLEMRIIHLVRDGRAVSRSSMKNLGLDPARAAELWVKENEESELARRHFPRDAWMTLRYEDLCRTPTETLERVHRFIGVTPQPPGDFRTVEQHVIGNRMRLGTTSEIRLDESWREALGPGELAVIEPIVSRVNARYAYAA